MTIDEIKTLAKKKKQEGDIEEITAFASHRARGRQQRKQSRAANSSSNYALTIRCRTMTADFDC